MAVHVVTNAPEGCAKADHNGWYTDRRYWPKTFNKSIGSGEIAEKVEKVKFKRCKLGEAKCTDFWKTR